MCACVWERETSASRLTAACDDRTVSTNYRGLLEAVLMSVTLQLQGSHAHTHTHKPVPHLVEGVRCRGLLKHQSSAPAKGEYVLSQTNSWSPAFISLDRAFPTQPLYTCGTDWEDSPASVRKGWPVSHMAVKFSDFQPEKTSMADGRELFIQQTWIDMIFLI